MIERFLCGLILRFHYGAAEVVSGEFHYDNVYRDFLKTIKPKRRRNDLLVLYCAVLDAFP